MFPPPGFLLRLPRMGLALPIETRVPSLTASVFLRRVEPRLSQINAWDRILGQKRTMRGLISIDRDELADLRERAAILCKETQDLIDEYRLLKGRVRRNSELLRHENGATHGVLCGAAPTLGAGSSSLTWKTPPVGSTLAPTHHRATKALARAASAK